MYATTAAMQGMDNVGNKSFEKMKKHIQNAEREVDKLTDELGKIPTQANNAAKSFVKMKNPLVTAASLIYTIKAGIQAIANTTGVVDNYTLTTARLELMNDELLTTAQLQDKIFSSAQRSRSLYADTAASIAKMGLLAEEAFSGTEEVVNFVELMNKSFKIGGASIQEQTSGMYQLTQAMAAGKLQGDEFRAIMENAPMLAQAIADYTGKTKGQLKEMSADGVITSDIIKGAMFAAADDINKKFKTLPMTFGDAMVNIKNESIYIFQDVMKKLNSLVNSTGFSDLSDNIVGSIKAIADWLYKFIEISAQIASFVKQHWSIIGSTIQGVLLGISVAYVAARVGAIMYAFAQGLVNMELLIFNARLLGVAALIALAVVLWNNFGVAGKILAIVLGAIAVALMVCTVAQYALNTALWSNPIVWVIALVVALIAIIIALTIWVIDLWRTNMDFKYGVIKIWNSILAFFDQVPIFFKGVGNAIADAFDTAKVNVLNTMQDMANGCIDIINSLISAVNKIPGVSIDTMSHVTFGAAESAKAAARKAGRDAKLQTMKEQAAIKAAQRDAEAQANRAKDEAKLAADKAKAQAAKDKGFMIPKGGEPDWTKMTEAAANPTLDGGTLDKVKGDVSITEQDIKLLKDVAATEFVNKYTTLKPEMKVTFGDVRETADVTKILDVIEDMVVQAYATSLVN